MTKSNKIWVNISTPPIVLTMQSEWFILKTLKQINFCYRCVYTGRPNEIEKRKEISLTKWMSLKCEICTQRNLIPFIFPEICRKPITECNWHRNFVFPLRTKLDWNIIWIIKYCIITALSSVKKSDSFHFGTVQCANHGEIWRYWRWPLCQNAFTESTNS